MDRTRCMDMIKRHEGLSLSVYEDSVGIPTVGYGFNLKKGGAQKRIEAMGVDYWMLLRAADQDQRGARQRAVRD